MGLKDLTDSELALLEQSQSEDLSKLPEADFKYLEGLMARAESPDKPETPSRIMIRGGVELSPQTGERIKGGARPVSVHAPQEGKSFGMAPDDPTALETAGRIMVAPFGGLIGERGLAGFVQTRGQKMASAVAGEAVDESTGLRGAAEDVGFLIAAPFRGAWDVLNKGTKTLVPATEMIRASQDRSLGDIFKNASAKAFLEGNFEEGDFWDQALTVLKASPGAVAGGTTDVLADPANLSGLFGALSASANRAQKLAAIEKLPEKIRGPIKEWAMKESFVTGKTVSPARTKSIIKRQTTPSDPLGSLARVEAQLPDEIARRQEHLAKLADMQNMTDDIAEQQRIASALSEGEYALRKESGVIENAKRKAEQLADWEKREVQQAADQAGIDVGARLRSSLDELDDAAEALAQEKAAGIQKAVDDAQEAISQRTFGQSKADVKAMDIFQYGWRQVERRLLGRQHHFPPSPPVQSLNEKVGHIVTSGDVPIIKTGSPMKKPPLIKVEGTRIQKVGDPPKVAFDKTKSRVKKALAKNNSLSDAEKDAIAGRITLSYDRTSAEKMLLPGEAETEAMAVRLAAEGGTAHPGSVSSFFEMGQAEDDFSRAWLEADDVLAEEARQAAVRAKHGTVKGKFEMGSEFAPGKVDPAKRTLFQRGVKRVLGKDVPYGLLESLGGKSSKYIYRRAGEAVDTFIRESYLATKKPEIMSAMLKEELFQSGVSKLNDEQLQRLGLAMEGKAPITDDIRNVYDTWDRHREMVATFRKSQDPILMKNALEGLAIRDKMDAQDVAILNKAIDGEASVPERLRDAWKSIQRSRFRERADYMRHYTYTVEELSDPLVQQKAITEAVARGAFKSDVEAQNFLTKYLDATTRGLNEKEFIEEMVKRGFAKSTFHAEEWLRQARGEKLFYEAGAFKKRTANLPFYDGNPISAISKYYDEAMRDLYITERLGVKGEKLKQLQVALDESLGFPRITKDLSPAERQFNQIIGKIDPPHSMQDIAKFLLGIQTVSKLGPTAGPRNLLAGHVQMTLRASIPDTIRAIRKGSKDWDEAERFVRTVASKPEFAYFANEPAPNFAKWWLKRIGSGKFNKTEVINYVNSSLVGRFHVDQLAAKLVADPRDAVLRQRLQSFRIDPDVVIARGRLTDMERALAADTMWRTSQQIPDFWNQPAKWLFTDEGSPSNSILRQFMKTGYAGGVELYERLFKDAAKVKVGPINVANTAKFMTVLPTVGILYNIPFQMSGYKRMPDNLWEVYTDGLDAVFGLAIYQDISHWMNWGTPLGPAIGGISRYITSKNLPADVAKDLPIAGPFIRAALREEKE